MKPIVFDLDDLCDQWNPWDTLMRWKNENPNGKVTLFTIPRRSSDELIERYNALDWVELGMHGWWHHKGECLYWGEEILEPRMDMWETHGLAKVFKAPHWLTTKYLYEPLEKRGWIMADHAMNKELWEGYKNIYLYEKSGKTVPYQGAHGHTHNVCGNGIEEAFNKFRFHGDATFKFITEVVDV